MKDLFILFVLAITLYARSDDPSQFRSAKSNLLPPIDTPYREFTKGQDAIDWWNSIYGINVFTKEERDIIYEYTFGDFFMINDHLRAGKPVSTLTEEQKSKVKKLDEALSKTYIFDNFIVYRYERLGFLSRLIKEETVFSQIYKGGAFLGGAEKILDTLISKRYKDYGFMSTTMIKNSVFQQRVVELHIKAPKQTKAAFVSIKGLAAFETQYELLFPRNKILTIEGYKISDDRKRLTIDVQMQPPCLYSRSCDEIHVDNLKQPQFDLKPAESTKYKNPEDTQSNSTTPKGRTKYKAF